MYPSTVFDVNCVSAVRFVAPVVALDPATPPWVTTDSRPAEALPRLVQLISAYSLHRSRLSSCLCGLHWLASLSLTSGPIGMLSSARFATSASASSLILMASDRARHSDECAPAPKEHFVQSGIRHVRPTFGS